jgi:hypothetical protein
MGLRYRNEWAAAAAASSSRVDPLLSRWQKGGYLLLAVVFRWLWGRASAALATVKTQLELRVACSRWHEGKRGLRLRIE